MRRGKMHICNLLCRIHKPWLSCNLDTLLLKCDRFRHNQLSFHIIKCNTMYLILVRFINKIELLVELRIGNIIYLYNIIVYRVCKLSHALKVLLRRADNGLHHVLCIADIIMTHCRFIPVIEQQANEYRGRYRHKRQRQHDNRLYIRHFSFLFFHTCFPICSIRYLDGDIPYLRLKT